MNLPNQMGAEQQNQFEKYLICRDDTYFFTLSGRQNLQNNRIWTPSQPNRIIDQSLHELKVLRWYVFPGLLMIKSIVLPRIFVHKDRLDSIFNKIMLQQEESVVRKASSR